MDKILWGSFSLAGVRGMCNGTNECFEVRRAKALSNKSLQEGLEAT